MVNLYKYIFRIIQGRTLDFNTSLNYKDICLEMVLETINWFDAVMLVKYVFH